jgi:glycolate oxidase iron-sulfur subunit
VLASHYRLEWKKWFFYKKVIMGKRTLPISRWSLKLIKQSILKYLPFNPKIGAIYLQNLPLTEKFPLNHCLPEIIPARTSDTKGRIIYFPGCLTNYILPSVGIALVRVLTLLGYEVILPKKLRCCSYPVIIAGQEPGVLKNIDNNLQVLSSFEAIGIVTSCPTCGLALKKGYLSLLASHNKDLTFAQRISYKTWDITEFIYQNINLPQLFLLEEALNHSQDIVYHDPCHLAFGQAIRREPREILQQLPGRKLKEIGGPISCCGSGGAFHLFSPDISIKIGNNRVQEIQKTEAKDIATGCPACILQLNNNLPGNSGGYQVLHTIQWVDKVITKRYKVNNRYY